MEREPLRPTGHFERRPLPYPLFGQQFVQVINASYRPPGKPDDQIPFRQAGTKRNAKSALARPPRPSSPCSGSLRDRRWRSPTDPLDLLRLAQRRRRQVRRSGSDGYVTDTACPGRILLVEQQVSLSFDQRPNRHTSDFHVALYWLTEGTLEIQVKIRLHTSKFFIELSARSVLKTEKKPNPISHLVNRVRVRGQTRRRGISPTVFAPNC